MSITRSNWDLKRHHAESCRFAGAIWSKQSIDLTLLYSKSVLAYCHLVCPRVSLAKILCAHLIVVRVILWFISGLLDVIFVVMHILVHLEMGRQFPISPAFIFVIVADRGVNKNSYDENEQDLSDQNSTSSWSSWHMREDLPALQIFFAPDRDVVSRYPEREERRDVEKYRKACANQILITHDASNNAPHD